LQKLPNALRHFYVLLVVCISFVLFNAESLPQAGNDLKGMFGFAGLPAVTGETLYYLRSFAILFAVGIFGATPIVKKTAERILPTWAGAVLEPLSLLAILLLCTGYLVDGSFSPFLYFRF
jgi:alginate O-acetyltransferase complex protein AlgI